MLVQTTITEKKEVTKEVRLPFHTKKDTTFYRINKDESLMQVTAASTWFNVSFTQKEGFWYKSELEKIVSADPCSEQDFLDAFYRATGAVDKSIERSEQPQPS